ncbi:TPA_asm: hypothetical protein G1216_02105 [Salmonella enterica]|uniref:Uncharacterized protein n=2 Tax=Salmonella enterica TaxID=28901 RepID=A0A633L2M8_SALER|nr:hypothetical protein [Salmonella enterica]EBP7400941.1 hypothetical protein [Salmonella enterica subsp. enterica]EBV6127166.1 hypothetical protein [Salmonella enterica subsp. enterica serovar Anatum]ECI2719782.1 hypothetical protein [Salmonella enterica subsp. enterica serovar Richmond]EDS8254226.1 hypothetical protein [Salmonella enterica subsp. enterica serovar Norwich]QDG46650.1 hypothetical protein AWA61_09975 [Salmonella enterica subsp. enterica serovar Anatum str. CFSAN003961]
MLYVVCCMLYVVCCMLYVVLEYCCLKAAIQRCYLKAIIITWYHIVCVMIGIVLQLLLIISRSAFF